MFKKGLLLTFFLGFGVLCAQQIKLADLPELDQNLPFYWHNHIERLKMGLQRDHCIEQVPRDDIAEHFGSFESSIANICLYLPRIELDTEEPLVFIVMHGTWARGNPEYWDPNNEMFRYLINFVKELAYRQARPVEIVAYQWSGQDTPGERKKAGKLLRSLVEGFYSRQDGYGPLWGYGHSHAGNVFNIASQETHFDTLVYCGTPVVEGTQEDYRPLHIKRLYHIYSTSDPWQAAGSYDRASLKAFFSRKHNGRAYRSQASKRIINIRIQCNGAAPGHLYIKRVIPQFWELMDEIDLHYEYHSDLDANVFSELEEGGSEIRDQAPMITIRSDLLLREVLPRITSRSDGMQIAAQLSREIAYSQKQEQRFAAQYKGRNIHRGSGLSDWFYTNWRELGDTIVKMLPWLSSEGCKQYSLIQGVVDY